MVTEPKRFFELLDKSDYEVIDARLVNDETVEVHYRNDEEFEEQNNKVNIVIAAFTTAYARLKLYDLLDLLQERILYYDTDSWSLCTNPVNPNPRWETIWVISPTNWMEITSRRLFRVVLRIMLT